MDDPLIKDALLDASPQTKPNLRAADELFGFFEKQILSGQIEDGDPMPTEREIVARHGVSRTVVREALLALSNKGLIEARPRHRPVVRKPTYDTAMETVEAVAARLLSTSADVKNLFDMRIMMEVALARQAAEQASKEDLRAMKAALEANRLAVDDNRAFFLTDIEFHRKFYELSGNPLLEAIHKGYVTWLHPQWVKMPRAPERNHVNYLAHEAIFDGVLMRDADAAEAATRSHLGHAWAQVHKTFKAE